MMNVTSKTREQTHADHEAVGLFADEEHLQDAIRELESTAFPRDAISVRSYDPRTDLEERSSAVAIDSEQLEDDPSAPREAPVRTEEWMIGIGVAVGCTAYIGAVAAVAVLGPASLPATYAAILLGGAAGALLAGAVVSGFTNRHRRHIHDQVAHGGMVMWVRTPDKKREDLACDILTRHGATHVRVHDMP